MKTRSKCPRKFGEKPCEREVMREGMCETHVRRYHAGKRGPELDAPLRSAIPTAVVSGAADHNELSGPLYKLLLKSKKQWTVEELADALQSPPGKVRAALADLEREGKNVVLAEHGIELSRDLRPDRGTTRIDVSKFKGRKIRFGVTADNHLCSRYARNDVLEALFDIWAREGIDTVYQLGNMVDGEARFNKFDLLTPPGFESQIGHLIEHWPKRKGMTTHFVTGDDHEGWYVRDFGINFGRVMELHAQEAGREDMKFLSHMEHDVELKAPNGSSFMRLMHAGGGSAYAISYTSQKYVESLQGGEKPAVVLVGHFHKFSYEYPREVHVVQVGCFRGECMIETPSGRRRIARIAVGDTVLTAVGARRVTRVYRREYPSGEFQRIKFGRFGKYATITPTPEHPIMTLDGWKEAGRVAAGDWIQVLAATCKHCAAAIPYWRSTCLDCHRFRGKPLRAPQNNVGGAHFAEDILPAVASLREQGYRVIAIGSVVPDAIAIKNGKVYAVEVEDRVYANNPEKYRASGMDREYDGVLWLTRLKEVKRPRREYIVRDGAVFAPVLSSENIKIGNHGCRQQVVYNLETEAPHSYYAGRVLVHNCTEDQTPFMRKKRIQAMVGGVTVEFELDDWGIIHDFKVTWHPFYDRDFYERNWQYHWPGGRGLPALPQSDPSRAARVPRSA